MSPDLRDVLTFILAGGRGERLYPLTRDRSKPAVRVELIIIYAGIVGLFQGGLDLVFFDELMKTVPADYSATFVSVSQSMQYLSMIVETLLGTWLAGFIGLGGALLVSAGLRLFGFLLFLKPDRKRTA